MGGDVPADLTDFPHLVHVKSLKKPWKGLFCGQKESVQVLRLFRIPKTFFLQKCLRPASGLTNFCQKLKNNRTDATGFRVKVCGRRL